MGNKSPNAVVEIRQGESLSGAISKFKKQCRNSGMHYHLKPVYVSRSEKKRLKKYLAKARIRRHARKRAIYYKKYGKEYSNE